MASEVIEADTLHLFLLSDGAPIDEDEYFGSKSEKQLNRKANPEIVELF